jgi:long-chain acyl-CoA synthetase
VTPDGFRHLTIGGLIRAAAARDPAKPALTLGAEQLSYGELGRRLARVANAAAALGLVPGDRAVLIAGASLGYVEVVAGLAEAGVVTATLDPRLTAPELAAILADCAPRLVLADPEPAALIGAAAERVIVLGPEYEAWIGAASDRPTGSSPPEWANFAISYTSGTTGQPKGVLLPHRSRVLTALAAAAEYRCFGPRDVFLSASPLHHGAGLAFALANLLLGGTTALLPRFDAEACARTLARSGATGVFVVPTMLARLLDQWPAGGGRGALQAIICNATHCPQPLKERAIARLGPGLLHDLYGSTEAGCVLSCPPARLLDKPGSVGLPFPLTEIAIRAADGSEARVGEVGALWSRSPYVFGGYLGRVDATAEVLRDGWVTAGDLASRDADGFVTIAGRAKDVVVTGGVNVYPAEVEAVLTACPGVADAGVAGVAHPDWGEAVTAWIVPESGADPRPDAVLAFCRERLAPHKLPKSLHLVGALPRGPSGKLLRARLRASL